MHLSQQRIIPRWKEWVPLATQEYRLRKLFKIIAMNVGAEDMSGNICKKTCSQDITSHLYYYTLHATALSSPFYTSEKIKSTCPKWKDIDGNAWVKDGVFSGTEAFVFRLWCHNSQGGNDEVITVWGVHLSGLILIGQNLSIDAPSLKPNTIIFLMPGGYYTHPDYVMNNESHRKASVNVAIEDVRFSYSMTALTRLHSLQRKIVETSKESEVSKLKILTGAYSTSKNRGNASLRKILNRTKPTSSHLDVEKLKKAVEIVRFRVQTLREEKSKLMERVKLKKELIEALNGSNQMLDSWIMEKYRLLHREVQMHREWLKKHIEERQTHLHASALLKFRTKQLISELHFIYPVDNNGEKLTICDVYLPDSESFAGQDELQLSVGLGFVAHCVQMISVFLQVPLRYPIVHFGSRSRIIDPIADKIPENEREFPLFCKGQDKLQFNYAVYLLNKNIAQLRCLCGLGTYDLRCTLANLSSLLRVGVTDAQQEIPFRSPSSSTFDLASSLSISSPVEGYMSPRHIPCRTKRVSESWIIINKSEPPAPVGHRVTKSAGSAADFHLNPVPIPIFDDQERDVPLANNLSYSLDKGLDEFMEITRIERTDTIETPVPYSLGGSETSLPTCLSKIRSVKEPKCLTAETSTSKYLKTWEAERNAIFFDEDSDISNSGSLVEKAVNNFNDNSVHVVEVYSECTGKGFEVDRVSLGLEVCDDASHLAQEIGMANELISVPDSLMANVTNRTEALASSSSSFNMFRSRFRTN